MSAMAISTNFYFWESSALVVHQRVPMKGSNYFLSWGQVRRSLATWQWQPRPKSFNVMWPMDHSTLHYYHAHNNNHIDIEISLSYQPCMLELECHWPALELLVWAVGHDHTRKACKASLTLGETFCDSMYVRIILKHFWKRTYVARGTNRKSGAEPELSIGPRGIPLACADEVHSKGSTGTGSRVNTRKTGPSYLLFPLNQLLLLRSLSNPLLLHGKN